MSNKRRRYKIKVVPVIIAVSILVIILGVIISSIISLLGRLDDDNDIGATNGAEKPAISESVTDDNAHNNDDPPAVDDSATAGAGDSVVVTPEVNANVLPNGLLTDWNLILLNYEDKNSIGKELIFDKVKFDTQSINARLQDTYEDMYEAAKADGINLYIRSGYRSIQTQQVIYNASVQRYIDQGMSREEATLETNKSVEKPGHSEHQTGLALDVISPEYHMQIYTLDERFAETAAYSWLVTNGPKFGFVLRYPADKVEITKMNYEPWHFRYVGVDHALYMQANNYCLEEYIEILRKAGRDPDDN